MFSKTTIIALAAASVAQASYLPPSPPSYDVPEVPSYPSEVAASSEAPVPTAPVYSPVYPSEVVSSAEAIISSVPAGEETVYSTLVYTITSCAPDVPNCPARSTVVSSTVIPVASSSVVAHVSSSSAPAGYPVPSEHASIPAVSSKPAPSTAEGNKPVSSASSATIPVYPVPTKPAEEEETCPPTITVKTHIQTSYETLTIAGDCPEPTQPSVVVPPPQVPTGGNATVPAVPTYTAPVSGAGAMSGSVLVAGLFAVAAYAFA